MNLKRLNEELNKLIMNEISDETKQHVVDKRRANYLAAQATADRLKAKYNRVKDKVAMSKKQYKEVATSVKDEIKKLFNKTYASVYNEKGTYMIEVTFYDDENTEEISSTTLEQLEQLLAEMTEKYGLKYSYKVEGDNVIITCEKPEKYVEEDIMKQLKDGTFDGKKSEALYELYKNIDKLSVDDLVKMMDNHRSNNIGLFPSEWGYGLDYIKDDIKDEAFKEWIKIGYPEKFAQALVKSKEADSLSDIWNIFYSSRNISDEARDIWEQDVYDNLRNYVGDYITYDIISLYNPDNKVELEERTMGYLAYYEEDIYNAILDYVLNMVDPDQQEQVKQVFKDLQNKVEKKGPHSWSN